MRREVVSALKVVPLLLCLAAAAACRHPASDDESGGGNADFGDWNDGEKEVYSATPSIENGQTHRHSSAPVDRYMNVWFTYWSPGAGRVTLYFVDEKGEPYVFRVEEGHVYRLVIAAGYAQYLLDGVDQFSEAAGPPADPSFSIPGGTFESDLRLAITSRSSGAEIHYTTDGSEPAGDSSLYAGPILVGASATIKAIAYRDGLWSAVSEASYTIHPGKPSFSKAAGTYSMVFDVALSSETSLAQIRYTVDGSEPDADSTLYAQSVPIRSSVTVKAAAFLDVSISATVSAAYTIVPATPVFSLPAATYWDATALAITCPTAGAEIRYTLDGSDPDGTSTLYDSPLQLTGSVTVKAIAVLGGERSSVTSRTYAFYPPQGDVGKVSAVAAAAGSRYFYATDYDKGTLHKIDAQEKRITSSRLLPHPNPIDMELDPATGIAYIIYQFRDKITRFDMHTESILSEYDTDSTDSFFKILDIALAPVSDRIYALVADGTLVILEMSTGREILPPTASVRGKAIVSDDAGHLVCADLSYSTEKLTRYDVSADSPVLEEQVSAGTNGRHLVLSPDRAHLAFPCGGGNDPRHSYTIFDYCPTNFANVQGEWDLGIYPLYGVFSPDSRLFYAFDGDLYTEGMHVYSIATYGLVRNIKIPNTEDYTRAAVSPDGQRMVAFSYETYGNVRYRFWFVENLRD